VDGFHVLVTATSRRLNDRGVTALPESSKSGWNLSLDLQVRFFMNQEATRKLKVDLHGVPRTLLLPLIARAKLSEAGNPFICDEKAIEAVQRLDFDFDRLTPILWPPSVGYLWTVRDYKFDQVIRAFLEQHPSGMVVNVGAGLETGFYRVDNGKCLWVDLDLPEVIALREGLFSRCDRQFVVPKSLLDHSWFGDLPVTDEAVLFTAGGVFMYFTEAEIRDLLISMSTRFDKAQIVFEVVSKLALKHANRKLEKAGIADAMMKWGCSDGSAVANWSEKLQVLHQEPFYRGKKPTLGMMTKLWMYLSDFRRDSMMIHVGFV